jgi:hypothetical protein
MNPALIAVLVVDGLGVACLGLALLGAVHVVLGWESGAPTAMQLALERRSEEVSAVARLGLALHLTAAFVLLIALNHVLPGIVPGAMCGVGALQAMPGGTIALAVRGAALAGLTVWATLDALNRSSPTGALAGPASRALLVVAPVAFVAAWQMFQAITSIDVHEPVSCCAAVYDLGARSGPGTVSSSVAGTPHLVGTILGAALIASLAAWMRHVASSRVPPHWLGGLLAAGAWGWTFVATWTLIDVFGPALYGVLGHRCPLCFFLPHHGAVGYPLALALAVVLSDSLAILTAITASSGSDELREPARRRVRAAGLRIAIAVLVFTLLAAGPTLVWRLRHGVWIDGSG